MKFAFAIDQLLLMWYQKYHELPVEDEPDYAKRKKECDELIEAVVVLKSNQR